jgi:hypothetical protein
LKRSAAGLNFERDTDPAARFSTTPAAAAEQSAGPAGDTGEGTIRHQAINSFLNKKQLDTQTNGFTPAILRVTALNSNG